MKDLFPKNSPLMKKVIKLMGILVGHLILKVENSAEKNAILKHYDSIIYQYSSSGEKDFLRIAVIKSLKFSLPMIFELLRNDHYEQLISYSKTFIRLLQDEIPEIRQKMGNFLSRLLRNQIEDKENFENCLFNCNVVVEKYLSFLLEQYQLNPIIHKENVNTQLLLEFYLSNVFESEFFNFKKTNYFEKRIFSFDKPNKYHDDISLKNLCYFYLKELCHFLNKNNPMPQKTEFLKIIESFALVKKYFFLVINNFFSSLILNFF